MSERMLATIRRILDVTPIEGADSICLYHVDGWQVVRKLNIEKKMRAWGAFGLNVALQGELVGPGIQGNIYGLAKHEFYLFDIFNITKQKYVPRDERLFISETLQLKHVPFIDMITLDGRAVGDCLEYAKGTSCLNLGKQREGLVFKQVNGQFSFKVINNDYLLKQKD